MTVNGKLSSLLLALILAYSLAAMCWGVVKNPLAPDEARTIFLGRNMLTELGVSQGNVPTPADTTLDSYLGSAAIAPAAIAVADSFGGIHGARLLCVMVCLLLIVLLYKTGNSPRYGGLGLMTAATFAFLGLPLQLSSSANADALAALFLGASLFCVEYATGLGNAWQRALIVMVGALSLALAAATNYTVMLFVLPFILYVFLRHRSAVAGAFFLLPLLGLLALYGLLAVLPVWPAVKYEVAFFRPLSGDATGSPWVYVFNLLNMSFLLAVISIFHKDGGKKTFYLLVLAAPAFLIHLISTSVSYMHTAALLSLVILAPAAALGVVQLAELFSSHNDMRLAKPFFVTAVLVILCVFGIQQIKGLDKERPDLSSAVAFLKGQGSACSTLLVDYDYGSPEFVYRYYLGANSPPVRVVPIRGGDDTERWDAVADQRPDYVVVDSFHSVRSFDQAYNEYLAQGFKVAATYNMSLASGVNNITVFQKGAL